MYFVILAFIAIASFLIWYLLKHDHGRKLPVTTLWYACGFGVLAIVLALFIETHLLPNNFATTPASFSVREQLVWFTIVGFVEEVVKFAPLALFIYKRQYFREHTDGCIYFAICGLTFGLVENILYTSQYGAGVGVVRLLLTPFLHAATTSILGYYLINQKLQPNKRKLFILALIVIPLMHGLYDFGLGTSTAQFQVLSLMLTLLLTMGLFLYFMQANVQDKLALAQQPLGFAVTANPSLTDAVSHLPRYCESCGEPNTNRGAYCESCGRKL